MDLLGCTVKFGRNYLFLDFEHIDLNQIQSGHFLSDLKLDNHACVIRGVSVQVEQQVSECALVPSQVVAICSVALDTNVK